MSVTSTTATSASTPADQLPGQSLGQADFLKLMVAQLSSQDPMNPVSSTDFAAQLAQFSTLQATQTMQTGVASVQSGLAGMEANSLLGATVSLQTASGQNVTGVVSSVQYQSGTPSITINGQAYDPSLVTSVSQTPSN